jgi:hypothetical protein
MLLDLLQWVQVSSKCATCVFFCFRCLNVCLLQTGAYLSMAKHWLRLLLPTYSPCGRFTKSQCLLYFVLHRIDLYIMKHFAECELNKAGAAGTSTDMGNTENGLKLPLQVVQNIFSGPSLQWAFSSLRMGWVRPKRGCLLTLAYYAFPRWWVWRPTVEWYIGRGNQRTRRKTCPSATLSTINPTWIDPDANPGLRGERPATNDLSHGRPTMNVTFSKLLADVSVEYVFNYTTRRLRNDHVPVSSNIPNGLQL